MRIAILASGNGSTGQALIDASSDGLLAGAQVVLVASDRSQAFALERARKANIEALHLGSADFADRQAYCEALAGELKRRDVDLVCSAGFMKILSASFVQAFPERILNTHPSLLPAFPGAHSVADALAWGVKVTGATIHFVDEQVDHGPILLQSPVGVLPEDDVDSLHARIKEVERRMYPEAVRILVEGRYRLDGRTVHITE